MNYMYVIHFYDKSFRIITPQQSDAIQRAFDSDAKYVRLDGDIIALSSIARIESTKYMIAESNKDDFSMFGYPEKSDNTCMLLGLLPMTMWHTEQLVEDLEEKIAKSLQSIEVHKKSMEECPEVEKSLLEQEIKEIEMVSTPKYEELHNLQLDYDAKFLHTDERELILRSIGELKKELEPLEKKKTSNRQSMYLLERYQESKRGIESEQASIEQRKKWLSYYKPLVTSLLSSPKPQ